jgi:predicted transcriptional regulator
MEALAKPKTLRQRREALGIAQEHLARLAGVSHSMVCMLDAGYTPGRSRVRDQVLAVLDRLEAERGEKRFVPFAEVLDHLELGPDATDGPEQAA